MEIGFMILAAGFATVTIIVALRFDHIEHMHKRRKRDDSDRAA